MRQAALIISIVLHPLLMCTYGCLLLFFGIPDTMYDYLTAPEDKWRITFVVFIFSFLFPVINIYLLYKLKRIPALTLSDQKDRTFPYLITALFYFGLFYLMFDIRIWSVIKLSVFVSGFAILLTALINLRYKISAHMVGIGGLLGALISISLITPFSMTLFFVPLILLAGLTGFARLKLDEHRPSQVYAGFFLGLITQTVLFFAMQGVMVF